MKIVILTRPESILDAISRGLPRRYAPRNDKIRLRMTEAIKIRQKSLDNRWAMPYTLIVKSMG